MGLDQTALNGILLGSSCLEPRWEEAGWCRDTTPASQAARAAGQLLPELGVLARE